MEMGELLVEQNRAMGILQEVWQSQQAVESVLEQQFHDVDDTTTTNPTRGVGLLGDPTTDPSVSQAPQGVDGEVRVRREVQGVARERKPR